MKNYSEIALELEQLKEEHLLVKSVLSIHKEKIDALPEGEKHLIELSYITSRGNWYNTSWKGDIEKSGGIATNIGVHFFDMLMWIFGDVEENTVSVMTRLSASGHLELKKASVNWMLSIDENELPEEAKKAGLRTCRILNIDGESFEFSDGFTELHTRSYEEIIAGNGFRISETRKAIQVVHDIRIAK